MTTALAHALAEIIPPAADHRCRGAGCTARIERVGVCAGCARSLAVAEHDATLDPALRSIPELYRWATLASIQAEEYARRVNLSPAALGAASRLLDRRVVVLRGSSARGKTSLACALLRAVIDAGRYGATAAAHDMARRARFVSALEIAEPAPSREINAHSPEQIATHMPFVVLDDVGQEVGAGAGVRADERAQALTRVLAKRHDRHGRTVITTFATFRQWAATYGDGIARRYLQSEDPSVVVVDLDARIVRPA